MANTTIIIKDLRRSLESFNISSAIENSDNEAKTRMFLVEEFFQALGYSRGFDNGCLIPEYDADFANLKGKKVDYAIQFRSKPEIIVEVKKAGTKLNDRHLRQLNEYFAYTNDARIGILTNGSEYQFYCRNINGNNGLHASPFYTFNWEDINGSSLEGLADFYATTIEVNNILDKAQELFFVEAFEEGLFKELAKPSKEFVKAIFNNMNIGSRMTENIEKQIKGLMSAVSYKSAFDRLMMHEASGANSGIITTDEEIKLYHIIKTILAQHKKIETSSVGYRDQKGKFSILINDNQRQKVCDLYVTPNSKRIDIDGDKYEVDGIDSVVKLKKQLTDKALSFMQ